MTTTSHTILFSGMIAGDPHQGGATWAVLQYVLGLKRLGHDVFLVEPVQPSALQPEGEAPAASVNAAYFRQVVADFGLEGQAALLLGDSRETVGLPYDALRDVARSADVLINISGMLAAPDLIDAIPLRVYLDLDPAFIQLWHAVQHIDMRLDAHTHFVTVGQAIGQAGCAVPTCGKTWLPTLQPVVLDCWPVSDQITWDALTTVANWRGYGSIDHDGVFYGQKAHSLRRFFELPRRTSAAFAPALAIHPAETRDLEALARNHWTLLDPATVANTPAQYRRFIQGSKAEFGVAKSGYVASKCGWFSDRSACYLASGKPVLAQDTGFSAFLPTGAGLFAFDTVKEAATHIATLEEDYPAHARAARKMAEQYFDSDKVLTHLMQRLEAAA